MAVKDILLHVEQQKINQNNKSTTVYRKNRCHARRSCKMLTFYPLHALGKESEASWYYHYNLPVYKRNTWRSEYEYNIHEGFSDSIIVKTKNSSSRHLHDISLSSAKKK